MTEPNPQPTTRKPVLMPALVEAPFDYLVPDGTGEGALVEAKLAGRSLVGVVWEASVEAKEVPMAKLKPVTRVLEELPPLKREFRQWLDWVSDFTLAPKGAVLSLCGLAFAAKSTKKKFEAQAFTVTLPELTLAQKEAAGQLMAGAGVQKPVLLDGVTGSGKTEVYFHAIAEAIAANRQVLVLVPEISLTHQWLERFEKTFGSRPCVWHSRMTPAAKARAWKAVVKGEVQVVVGARSALFLPFHNLGLIVIDEEHDPSYKQEDGVLYHARDMAVVRARFENIPIILVSATPSLETLENVREGKYRALHLTERFGKAGLPVVRLIDMRIDMPERGTFISPLVRKEMLGTLARGEQVLFFMNRRGYAPLLLCRACGHRFQCAQCSAWLVVHGKSRLECHHCGHKEKLPVECPSCKAGADKLAPCGPGVERIAEEVRELFAYGAAGHASPFKGEDRRGPATATDPAHSGPTPSLPLPGREQLAVKTLPIAQTLQHARHLRKDMTDAEKKLWRLLRNASLGVKFRKQHPIGSYIVDFASLEVQLIIELDGGQHNDLEAILYDQQRTAFLESQGFAVLRFWNHEVMQNAEVVLEQIAAAIAQRNAHPNPPLTGEGIPRIAVLSSDEAIAAETWSDIEAGKIDIIVGTQMVAKGHHFPNLTLVVVVDADVGLDGADLRAGERTYQLLHQLGGRAGRGELAGTVLVQTYAPEHAVMKALVAHDRDRLMALEARERKAGGWPPFGGLAAILLDGVDESKVKAAAQMLARTAPADERLRVLGPAPAPLSKLRGQYRYRLLVKAAAGIHLQRTLRGWLEGQKFSGVRIKVDVNPYYFM